jgi:hypothetical protein
MVKLLALMDLKALFSYQPPTGEQEVSYQLIRSAGLVLAQVICANSPAGPDQSDAVRKVREAVMTANAAIATNNAAAVRDVLLLDGFSQLSGQ